MNSLRICRGEGCVGTHTGAGTIWAGGARASVAQSDLEELTGGHSRIQRRLGLQLESLCGYRLQLRRRSLLKRVPGGDGRGGQLRGDLCLRGGARRLPESPAATPPATVRDTGALLFRRKLEEMSLLVLKPRGPTLENGLPSTIHLQPFALRSGPQVWQAVRRGPQKRRPDLHEFLDVQFKVRRQLAE